MAAPNVKRSVSMRNGNTKSSYSSTSSVAINRNNMTFPALLGIKAVKKVEANEIKDILKKKIAFISGGTDRNGCWLISMPIKDSNAEFTFDDVTSTLSYLVTIPNTCRNDGRTNNIFTVIVDARNGWAKIKLVLRAVQHALQQQVQTVLIIKADVIQDKDASMADIKRDKAYLDFRLNFVSAQKLTKFVDRSQLTSEFGGSFPFNYEYWLRNRLSFEQFLKEANAIIRHMETVYFRLSSFSCLPDKKNLEEDLLKYASLYDTAMDAPSRIQIIGASLIENLETDGDSGFKKVLETKQNAELFYAREQIRKLLASVKHCQLKLTNQWQSMCGHLEGVVETKHLEMAIEKVVSWLLGPGEDLLSKENHIGRNFVEADGFRKRLEQLELHCTETFAAYAETRHATTQLIKENPEISNDIMSRKEYMDAVCRGFANRIEKRRNLLITSIRFHRTVQELFQRLGDLDGFLQTECTVEEWHGAEAAIQRLEDTFQNIGSLRDQANYDAERLLEILSTPLKNAFGKDVPVNNTSDIMHVKAIQSKIGDHLASTEELGDLRKLRLKQILHLSTCERDAQQAIVWILELCAVLVNKHIQVGCSLDEAYALWEEHFRFEETAKGTYEYGQQLLHTAITIRRSSGYQEGPNKEIEQRLFHAWKTFLTGSAERTMRLKVCMTFFRKSIEIIEKLNHLITGIAAELQQAIPSRKHLVVRQYASTKDMMMNDIHETVHVGRMLLERLPLPVIPEYRSDSDLCDRDASQQIEETINTIEDTSEELDSLMSETKASEASSATPLDTMSNAFGDMKSAASSMFEDWKSVASSLPEDFQTCPSSMTSGDEYYSAEEGLADGGRRTIATGSKQTQVISQTGTTANTRKPALGSVMLKSMPGDRITKYEECSKTTQLKETKISKTTGPGTKLVSISQEKVQEESTRTPGSSSHTKDSTTTYEQYIDNASSGSTQQPPSISVKTPASESPKPNKEASDMTNGQPTVRIHTIERVNGTSPQQPVSAVVRDDKMEAILKKVLDDEELRNDPLLKHINESKEWLQLKILEMEPDLAKLGSTLEEALEYQQQHEQVLQKLQGKQSPVEELLNQADQLISTQKPRAEVYAAMAESLGLAWRDLNHQLEHRKQLLEQSVAFQLRAKEFSDRLDKGVADCEDALLPSDADVVRKLLQQHHDMKKGILEASMHTLNEGQTLLERLKDVASQGTGDSRPGHLRQAANTAIYQVEHQMETLHDRRRRFEEMWAKRKLILEQCLQLCLLYNDITQVYQWLKTKGQEYSKVVNLGDSSASAEILQHEHGKVEIEAKQVQDRSIRLLRTAEQLNGSGHYAGSEAENKAYELLNAVTECTNKVDTRRRLLAMSVAFFRAAHSALTKLDQMEVQLSTLDTSSSSLPHQHAQIAQTLEETVSPALHEGYLLLDKAGRDDPGVQGVVRTVAELEERRKKIDAHCTAHRAENLQKSAAVKAFQNTFNNLYNWIVNNGDAFLQGHQDIGSVLAMAKDFLARHEQLMKDLMNKGPELEAVFRSLPNLLKSAPEDTSEIEVQIDKLRTVWTKVNTTLENRIQLARLYVNFHRLAVQLANDLDALETLIVSIRDGTQPKTDATASAIEEKWLTISQIYLQLKNTGKNFIFDAKKSKDPYLDIQRAILCVETLLEHFLSRQSQISNLRENWQSSVSQQKEIKTQWEKYVTEVHKTIQWIMSIQLELYPAISGDVMNVQSVIWDLERKMENFVPIAKKAQAEIEIQLKSSESLLLQDDTQAQKDQVLSELSTVSHQLNTHITEYQILLSMLIAYFKKVLEMEKMVEKLEMQFAASLLPTEVSDIEILLKEHDASKQAVLELFKFSANERAHIVSKIRNQEPEAAARMDEEKLIRTLELIQQHWEKAWQEHKRHLEQHLQLCHFNQDLRQINNQLNELSIQLANIRGNYGESLPAAKATSQAFIQFEKTIELLEHRINIFVSTAEKMLSDNHVEKQHIRFEIGNLQNKWSTFHMQIGENRKLINLAIDYFKLIEEAEEWFKEGSKLLIQIARRSTSCRSPQEANNLLNEMEVFLKPGEAKQEERLRKISTLAIQIYGQTTTHKVDSVSTKNREMLESFLVINEELRTLATNLRTAEQEREKQIRDKEEVDAALASAKAEAAAAKASAVAAEAARKAAEAAAKAIPPPRVIERVELRTIQKTEAVPLLPQEVGPPPPPPKPVPSFLDKKPQHVAPQFIVPLKDAEVLEGSKFKFECRITGFPAPDVQWCKDGINIVNNPDYLMGYNPHTGICTLTIEETFSEDSARFTCKAGNAAGIVETSGNLTVKESRAIEEYLHPEFTKNLEPGISKVGEPYKFECHVTGNPLPVVSWLKNDACIDNSPDYTITYNNGVCLLGIDQLRPSDDAKYTCRATNKAGVNSCVANLIVKPAELAESPSFVQPLSNVMARAGQKLRLECIVRGIPEPQITWLHNNKPIKETRDVKITQEDGKATLTIPEAFPKDAGTYVIVAKNTCGEAASSGTVTVKGRLPLETSDSELASDLEPVKPRILQVLKDISAPEHTKLRMDCIIVGQPEPEVIWYHDGVPVKESNDFQLLFEGDKCSLIIREAIVEDAGKYKVVAINSAGEASSLCSLSIKPIKHDIESSEKYVLLSVEKASAPKFSQLLLDTVVNEGDSIALQCTITGDPDPVIAWYKNGRELTLSPTFQITREKLGLQELKIPKAMPKEAGTYTIKACNMAGEAKCICHLTVNPTLFAKEEVIKEVVVRPSEISNPPVFKKLFIDQIARPGQQFCFTCTITGKPKVQWYFNGEPVYSKDYTITMENEEYGLYIPALKPENTGTYTCAAENDSGKAKCSAHLQVSEPVELIVGPIGDISVNSNLEKSYKMSTVTKSSSSMHKSFSSNTSETFSGGNVEFHKVATQEEHSMQKVGDKPMQEMHSSKREEVHRNEPSGGSVISQATKAFSNTVNALENTAPQFQSVMATMNAPVAPQFTKPIESIVIDAGGKVEFLARVEGYPEPSVKWYKNGSEMFRPEYPCKFENGVATMTIPKAVEKDSARYTCTARNTAGTASSTAELVVKSIAQTAPQFIKSLQAQVVKSGTRVEMEVQVSGAPEPEIKWFKNGQLLTKTRGYNVTKNGNVSTLILPQAHSEDSGKYMVKATNPAGEAHSVVDFVVEQDDVKLTPTPTHHTAQPHVKTTFSSKHVTIFEEKKQTLSKGSKVIPGAESLPRKIEDVKVTVLPRTDMQSPKEEHQVEHSAPPAKFWTAPKSEKATIESLVVEEELPPLSQHSPRAPPPTPPKPITKPVAPPVVLPKPKQVFSESEDEFVRKELTFEPPSKKERLVTFSPTGTPPPSKIPIYTPPPTTPSKFIPISESPLPSSGCEDEALQPSIWKPGGDQVVSTMWRPVKPPSTTGKATPPIHEGVHYPAPSQFEEPSPMNLFQKSIHIKEEFTSTHKEVKTFSPKPADPIRSPIGKLAILPVAKEPSPPLPEPGPPPEFGYVDPKTVTRPTRTVVPPKPPTPTTMPKGGVAVYPGIPNAGMFTPIGSMPLIPVFPKVKEEKPIPLKPGSPPEVGYIEVSEPSVTTKVHFTEETSSSTTTTTTKIMKGTGTLQHNPAESSHPIEFCPPAEIELAPSSETIEKPLDSIPAVWSPLTGGPSAPVFVKPLQDKLVNEGEKIVLECIVQGDPTPEINWFKDGQVLPPLPDLQSKYQYNVCQLTFPEALLNDQCTISCVAKNPAGSATTSAALRVKAKGDAPRSEREGQRIGTPNVAKRYANAVRASNTSSTSSSSSSASKAFHKYSSRKISN